MLLTKERHQIVTYGKQLVTCGLTSGTGGNLSILNRAKKRIAVSPSGIDYAKVKKEDVVIVTMDGEIVDGMRKPSSELFLHTVLYGARPDIGAVVHTHSPYATTFACLLMEIPAVHYLVGFAGRVVPVAPYETFGTRALAEQAAGALTAVNAALLANHGVVSVGKSMPSAFETAQAVEFVARIYYQAKSIGKPALLSNNEMKRVMRKFESYGQ